MVTLYLAFLGLLGLERVGELALSARNAKRAFARGAVEVGQRHYRVMALMHTLFLFACAGEAIYRRPQHLYVAALIGALAAQALRYWAISALGERWNTRVIVLPGVPPVVAGPYRWIRHPNYVAVVMEMLFVPLVAGGFISAMMFSAANAAVLWVRIRAEESALGREYADAFGGTSRFIPRRGT
jgi:methyltransferase